MKQAHTAHSVHLTSVSRGLVSKILVPLMACLLGVTLNAAAAPTTPTNLSPGTTSSPGPVLSSSSVTLTWSAVSGTTYYDLGVTDVSTGNLVVDVTRSTNSYSTTLQAGRPYRWNLRACNSTGCSSFTSLRYFQTPGSIPATPTNPTPGSTSSPGPVLSSTSVTLGWSSVSGATYYDVGVTDISTGNLVVDVTPSSTSHTTSLAAGKSYRWNLRACNSSGCSSFTSLRYFQTPSAAPAMPTGLSPGATSSPGPTLVSTSVTLDWGDVSGATYYDLGVTDIAAGNLVVDVQRTTSSFTTTLAAGKAYRWNLRACNSSGCSAFTSLLYFQTPGTSTPAPGLPTGMSPGSSSAPGPTLASGNVSLTWNAVSAATYYDLGVTDIATGNLVVDVTPSSNSHTTTLTAGKAYRWNLRACNSSGCSAFTSLLYFQTPAAATPVPNVPIGLSPGSTSAPGPLLSSSTVTLIWGVVSGATYYDLGVTDIAAGNLVVDVTPRSNSYSTTLIAGKSYRWNLRACNAAGCSAFTSLMYFQTPTGTTIPAMPSGLEPGSTSAPGPVLPSRTVTLKWTAVPGVTYYDLGVTDIAAAQLVVDVKPATNSYSVTLAAGKAYRWNLRACNTAGCSSLTALHYFQTPGSVTLSAPTLQSPNGAVTTLMPTLRWSEGTGAAYYVVEITNASTGAKLTSPKQSVGTTHWSVPSGYLASNARYNWVVVAYAATGAAARSQSLGIDTNGIAAPSQKTSDLIVSGLSVSPGSVVAGERLNVTFRMTNQGEGTAASSNTRLYIGSSASGPSDGDAVYAGVSIPALGPQQSSALITLDHFVEYMPPGQYYLCAVADEGRQTLQSTAERGNDRISVPLTVLARTAAGATSLALLHPASSVLESENPWVSLTAVKNSARIEAAAVGTNTAVIVRFTSATNAAVTIEAPTFGYVSPFRESYLTNPYVIPMRSVTVNDASWADHMGFHYLALFWSPQTLPGNQGLAVLADIIGRQGVNLSSTTLKLQPPPVVLLHGVWSNAAATGFSEATGGLNRWLRDQYPHPVIFGFDYGPYSARSFDDKDIQAGLESTIRAALRAAAANKMAARQVDLVGHSMGGLVARNQMTRPIDGSLHTAVRKLITIGTPHEGSALASFLLENQDARPKRHSSFDNKVCQTANATPCTLGELFEFLNKKIADGVKSLVPGSMQLRSLSSGSHYHAIVATAPPRSWSERALDYILWHFFDDKTIDGLLGSAHDTIVTTASQRGSSAAYVAEFSGLVHTEVAVGDTDETASHDVWKQVFRWLTNRESLLAKKIVPKSTGEIPEDLNQYTEVNASYAAITPTDESPIAAGVSFRITATPTGGKSVRQVLVYKEVVDPADRFVTAGVENSNAVEVLTKREGVVRLAVQVLFTDRTFSMLPLTYNAYSASAPIRLELGSGGQLDVTTGQTIHIPAIATFEAGSMNVSSDAIYATRHGGSSILQVGSGGTVSAIAPGVEWIDVSYGALTQSIEVEVRSPQTVELELSRSSIDFGAQAIRTTSPPTQVTIANRSAASISLTLASAPSIALSHDCGSLVPGGTCAASVSFTPSDEGTFDSVVTLTHGQALQRILIAGIGERSLVSHYYRSILRREPEGAGKQYWQSEAARVASAGANINETWYSMAQSFFWSQEYSAFRRNPTEYVTDLYRTFFNRAPDNAGLNYWTGQIDAGAPREVVLVSFMLSPEFIAFARNIFGDTSVRPEVDTVIDFYRGLLGRLPDTAGFQYWLGRFRAAQCSGASAVYAEVEAISSAFANSPEYAARQRTDGQYVADQYNAFMRRGGDLAGIKFWIEQLRSNARDRERVRKDFMSSPEFSARVAAMVAQPCLR